MLAARPREANCSTEQLGFVFEVRYHNERSAAVVGLPQAELGLGRSERVTSITNAGNEHQIAFDSPMKNHLEAADRMSSRRQNLGAPFRQK